MAVTIQQLFEPVQLTNAAVTIFTMPSQPASSLLRNGRVRFTNITNGAVVVTAYAVPSGGSAGNTNAFLYAESIGPEAYLDVDLPVLAAGDFIKALAGANTSINMFALDGVIYS